MLNLRKEYIEYFDEVKSSQTSCFMHDNSLCMCYLCDIQHYEIHDFTGLARYGFIMDKTTVKTIRSVRMDTSLDKQLIIESSANKRTLLCVTNDGTKAYRNKSHIKILDSLSDLNSDRLSFERYYGNVVKITNLESRQRYYYMYDSFEARENGTDIIIDGIEFRMKNNINLVQQPHGLTRESPTFSGPVPKFFNRDRRVMYNFDQKYCIIDVNDMVQNIKCINVTKHTMLDGTIDMSPWYGFHLKYTA